MAGTKEELDDLMEAARDVIEDLMEAARDVIEEFRKDGLMTSVQHNAVARLSAVAAGAVGAPGTDRRKPLKATIDHVYAAAKAAHEANRAYCQSIGDNSQPHWELSQEWQRESARNGVQNILLGEHSPEKSHESWLAEKDATGWKFGPVKDLEKKEHPCMVPYDQLPPEQQAKDQLFVDVVLAMLKACGVE